ncbi:Integrase core domain-containing protein [Daejeonella rubra]|uniref:Integrase core domain-containing protein n=1 Tax=Daejeonella rubra TaxID=990371 RepID=A0A1G9Z7D3_9SPHI|nr:IS21 family transposase [Daejeonella rubra]SDN17292.1 Integrase core domain-containing protein [Daejeonella rubra]
MANKLLSMHKIRQILLFLDRGVSQRAIEKEVQITRKTIALYLQKFQQTGQSLTELIKLSDDRLEQILGLIKPSIPEDTDPRKIHFNSLIEYFNIELKRTGVTRLLLWEEYIKEYPSGFQYSRFCDLLQDHIKLNDAVMHFVHYPAKLMEVDFAGDVLHYVDPSSGELIACPVFVAILPFSGYGYVEALPDAKLTQVVRALNNAIDYYGGVPQTVKSDNMKQWVSKSCRYEPVFTDMLEQWANHNNIALLAARPYKPKDKASVENNVKITYRRVYAGLRNDTFHSLSELNKAIRAKLDQHHQLNFQKKTFSRQELFDSQERSLLQPLPESVYNIRHYTKAKVQKHYHVLVGEDWHFYSVPYRYIGKEVRIIYCTDTVEIYCDTQRIAVHTRNFIKHGYTTIKEHMPERHQAISRQRGWSPEYYLKKAEDNGPHTYEFFKKVMDSKLVIDQSYTACLGLLRLMRACGAVRMEAACKRGLRGHKFSYGAIKKILDNNMDLLEDDLTAEFRIPAHTNLRGPEAYN